MTSAEQIEIAPIALDHVEGFHRALDRVARERKYLSVFEAFPVEAMKDFILHQNKTGGPAFVALKAGEVIGWCDIRRQAFPAFAHRGSVGMGVVAEWRGRGIGLRLLDAAIKDAFRRGLVRVELEVRADNARAIALYEKIGFAREGIMRDAVLIDGQYFDAIAMAMIRGSR
jgi:RimJ/RimL family protein N-acetyltransferase